MFKKSLSALLIASLLSPAIGCGTITFPRGASCYLSDNDGLNQDPDGKIEIRTKDGTQYFLSDWRCNASGDYIGIGKRVKNPYVTNFSGTIAFENITSVRNREFEAGNASSKNKGKAIQERQVRI